MMLLIGLQAAIPERLVILHRLDGVRCLARHLLKAFMSVQAMASFWATACRYGTWTCTAPAYMRLCRRQSPLHR